MDEFKDESILLLDLHHIVIRWCIIFIVATHYHRITWVSENSMLLHQSALSSSCNIAIINMRFLWCNPSTTLFMLQSLSLCDGSHRLSYSCCNCNAIQSIDCIICVIIVFLHCAIEPIDNIAHVIIITRWHLSTDFSVLLCHDYCDYWLFRLWHCYCFCVDDEH